MVTNKKTILFMFFAVFTIISISMISAKPVEIETTSFTSGYFILETPQVYIEQNTDWVLYFHLNNISNGAYIDNETANCTLHLANDNGNLLLDKEFEYNESDGRYWFLNIGGGNFSELGSYFYGISCIETNNNYGGYKTKGLIVTSTGEEPPTQSQGIIITISLLVIFALAGLFLMLGFKTDMLPAKIIFYSTSIVFIFVTALYSMALLANILGNYNFIVDSYSSFYMVFKIIISSGVLALLLYAGLMALKLWQFKRGYRD